MRKGVDYPGVTLVFFCHDGNGRFVMAKRSQNARDEQGNWDIGGGGLEFGDDVLQKIRDEITEEYCTEAIEIEFLGYRDVHRKNREGQDTHWIALDFKVRVNPATVSIGEPHKFDEIGWFTLKTVPANLHSQLPVFFDKYGERL
jgi:8-oxo-dGTP diphosphatase